MSSAEPTDPDLVAFLRARLGEDEQTARAATPGPWRWGDWSTTFGTVEQQRRTLEHAPERGPFPVLVTRGSPSRQVLPSLEDSLEDAGDHEPYEANATHIARWDPARVLADVAAKRRIIDEIVPEVAGMDEAIEGEWGPGAREYSDEKLLRLLALPYAAHPDYRAEWGLRSEQHDTPPDQQD